MKRFILLLLMFPCIMVCANEITEDYTDIATNYCIYGKYNDALNYVDKILQIEPYNNDVKELKNTLLRVMNPNIQSYLSSTNQNLNQAFLSKRNGDREGFVNALSGQNDYWSSYFLAEYYRENNNLQNALEYYKKAIELKPNHSQSYLGLGITYAGLQEYQNAIDAYTKYLTYNRDSDAAYALRAAVNLNMNYISDAESDIKKALSIEENVSYLLLEAKILYYKGNYDLARQKFTMLSRMVQTSEVFKFLGLCDYAQGDYTNAMINLDKAIILSDEDKTLISTYNNIKSILNKR